MESRLLVILWWSVCFLLHADNPIDECAPHLVYGGAPISSITTQDQYLIKSNFAIHYRYDTKTAEYVAEHLNRATFTLVAERLTAFSPDEEIPVLFRATLSDYRVPNIDRGHLSPANDNVSNRTRMNESFLLSNVVPQNSNNNRGIWKLLEGTIRRYVYRTGHDLYVISGTYYTLGYATIGAGVGVPSHLWKMIIDPLDKKGVAYFLPNVELDSSTLDRYRISIGQLERRVKITFGPKMPASCKIIKQESDQFLSNIPK